MSLLVLYGGKKISRNNKQPERIKRSDNLLSQLRANNYDYGPTYTGRPPRTIIG